MGGGRPGVRWAREDFAHGAEAAAASQAKKKWLLQLQKKQAMSDYMRYRQEYEALSAHNCARRGEAPRREGQGTRRHCRASFA